MNDQTVRRFSGQTDACSVLIDVLIAKGVITQDEVLDHIRRGQHGTAHGSGKLAGEIAETVEYVVPGAAVPDAAQPGPSALTGETVLVVQGNAAAAEELQSALERAGAEVLVARSAVEALARIAQFDFSAAVLECRPETREHRTLARWLREDGVRFLYASAEVPAGAFMATGLPIVAKTARPHDIAAALVRLRA
jgi:CheY-like chemotaxis protein